MNGSKYFTTKTFQWLTTMHGNEIKDIKDKNELKKFVWGKCKSYITNQDSFIKGMNMLDWETLVYSLEAEQIKKVL